MAIGLGVATTLIVLGGDDGNRVTNADEQSATDGGGTLTSSNPSNPSGSPDPSDPASSGDNADATSPTLPSIDMTADELSRLGGLEFPEDMTDFRSVALENNLQFDITFTIPASSVDTFIRDSELPTPVEGNRVLIHASPLWDMNPPEGTTVAASKDRHGDVDRAVELLTVTPDQTTDPSVGSATNGEITTVRITLTPSL